MCDVSTMSNCPQSFGKKGGFIRMLGVPRRENLVVSYIYFYLSSLSLKKRTTGNLAKKRKKEKVVLLFKVSYSGVASAPKKGTERGGTKSFSVNSKFTSFTLREGGGAQRSGEKSPLRKRPMSAPLIKDNTPSAAAYQKSEKDLKKKRAHSPFRILHTSS